MARIGWANEKILKSLMRSVGLGDRDIKKALIFIKSSGLTAGDLYRLKSDVETKEEIKRFILDNNISMGSFPDESEQKDILEILSNRGYPRDK